MSVTNFNTENQTLRKLLGNGITYSVPAFQRDYSWTTDEWEDLWEDIISEDNSKDKGGHYMGYLVLQTNDDKKFDIIDGQQRIATVTIIILACLKLLNNLIDNKVDAERNKQRMDLFRSAYIGYLDPQTLISKTKLTLNRNNDGLFKSHLINLDNSTKFPNESYSLKLLRSSYDWHLKKCEEYFKLNISGESIAKFIDELVDKLFFTVITVNNDLNAFKVFETLNSRGVRLSPSDLLKNRLFSIAFKEQTDLYEMEDLEQKWEVINQKLGSENFTDFLRVHWNSRNEFVREKQLFKSIKEKIDTKQRVFSLIRDIQSDLGSYYGFTHYEEWEYWTDEQRSSLEELKLFRVRLPWALMLCCLRHIKDHKEINKIFRAISIIAFRYNIVGRNSGGEQERVLHGVTQKINKGEIKSSFEIIRELSSIYPTDAIFKTSFAEMQIKTSSGSQLGLARYILGKLEDSEEFIDFNNKKITIEHIYPQNPKDDWKGFENISYRDYSIRLGNMILLEDSLNKECGNLPFIDKILIYNKSNINSVLEFAKEHSEWNSSLVHKRQQALAKKAASIWRIDQLSK